MVRERLEVGDEARFVVLHESEGLLVRPVNEYTFQS
jgi:hypothetical protein